MLVNDKWNIHEGQPLGAEAVTLEPTVQHSSDESPVIMKDHIHKTVNARTHHDAPTREFCRTSYPTNTARSSRA